MQDTDLPFYSSHDRRNRGFEDLGLGRKSSDVFDSEDVGNCRDGGDKLLGL